MSSINEIIRTFETLGNDDREATLRALTTMARAENSSQPAKKKVNGFMGYRAYYSSLFTQLTQKERSPIMTTLWKQDPFHKEWDFMCAVYSVIREFLSVENVSLQNWIQFAVKHLGVVVRDKYLSTLGWKLVRLEDGTHKLQRAATGVVQSYTQPLNGLGLFMNCLNDGLPVANPLPIIAKLSGLTNDVICINTQRGEAPKPTNTMESFRQFAKTNPQLAMSALFQLPADHPAIAHGVTVHHIPQASELPANGSLYTTQSDDPELDAMLDRILRGEDDNGFGNQAGMGHQFYPMGMNSGAPEGFN